MCGIIAGANIGKNAKNINEWIIEQYEDQHARGEKGFGIVTVNKKMKYEIKRATEGFKFIYDLYNSPSKIMMVHHRWPTSTKNKIKQTHPILVNNGSLKYTYLVVHNGVIYNDDDVKKAHEKLGFQYTTWCKNEKKFNDSETFAIEVARYIENQTDIMATQGSAAFVALQIDRKTEKVEKMIFGRHNNPLNMAKTRGEIRLSSEGKGDEIEENKIYECKLNEKMKLNKRKWIFEIEKEEIGFKTYSSIAANWGDDHEYNYSSKTIPKEEKKELIYESKYKYNNDDLREEYNEIEEMIENAQEVIIEEIDVLITELKIPGYAADVDIEGCVKRIRETLIMMSESIIKAQADELNQDIPITTNEQLSTAF